MEIFTINNNEDVKRIALGHGFTFEDFKDIDFVCEYYETRSSWGHKGVVREHDTRKELVSKRIRYYNRTWECYTYQSLLTHLVYGYMTYLTNIDYNKALVLDDEVLEDFINLKRRDFLDKYKWCDSSNYRETVKHYKRIGVIQ